MLCTHPSFLGLHTCNKMGSTPVLPRKIRQNQHTKKNFFYAAILDHFPKKMITSETTSFQNLSLRFRISKNFGHPTSGSGGKHIHKCIYAKRDRHTYIQLTSRLLDWIGPVGRFDENHLVFLVPCGRFQYFRHLLQNPNLKLMAGFSNNHYWSHTF